MRLLSNKSIYFIFLILLLVSRFLVIKSYGVEFVGSDDLIFWQATKDYASGIFYEPFFYGQNYNFMLEALLAVPFYKLGIPIYTVLPLISTLIFLFPFILFSIVLYKRAHFIGAYLFLLIPLAMPVQYDIMTTITRGFISGFLPMAFFIYPLLNPCKRVNFLIFGLCSSFAFALNPNTAIFSFMIGLYLLFKNYRSIWFYIIVLVTILPAFSLLYFAEHFYILNPNYVVHTKWNLLFSFNQLAGAFSNLDKYFKHLTPFFWGGHWMIVLLIIGLGIYLLKKKKREGIVIIISSLFILFTLGVNKIADGTDSIFLSSSRMFLALPLSIALALFWFFKTFEFSKTSNFKLVLLVVGLCMFLFKASTIDLVIFKETSKLNIGAIANARVGDLKNETKRISDIVIENEIDKVVFVPGWDFNVPSIELLNYSYDVLNTVETPSVMVYDRRTWEFNACKDSVFDKVLLYGGIYVDSTTDVSRLSIKRLDRNPDIFIIDSNDKILDSIGAILNFKFKRRIYD